MAKLHVSTTINGEPQEFLCDAEQSMLDVLRGPLGLTGSKEGCGTGDCGACTITVNGRIVCSCLMLAAEAEGGICTPGVLMAAKALLEQNPDPTEHEVRFWLAGNLCRCTGYDKIIRAVMDTAADMRGAAR